ncbi:DNA/RNA non-specific endonuclease [uncultured Gemella sp.]|uniref:DNA/RNA non-specific endonuclease n=1 Tax=uncultured Gemella sp. TaxID=254352 RepID=UPI00345CB7A0
MSAGLDNLLSQAKDVNLKTYRRLERDWSESIKVNKKVEVHVKIEYVGNSARPKTFRINYIIDGQTFTCRIKNINGVK